MYLSMGSFDIDMSFSKEDIAGMLRQYEDDYHTGMDIERLSGLLYEYTSGYPFLVSRICKLMDEKIAGNSHISDKSRAWTDDSFYEAEKNENHMVMIANRIFEAVLYEYFTAEEYIGNQMYDISSD